MRIEEIGDHDGRAVDGLVDQEPGRHVAAGGSDELQQTHAVMRAEPWSLDHGTVAKAERAVVRRRFVVAAFGQDARQALMRLGKAGRERERRLVVRAGGGRVVGVEQHVGEIDARHGRIGMARDRLAIARARGAQISGRVEEGAEIVERAQMRGLGREHGKIVGARRIEPAERGQDPGAAIARLERVRRGRELLRKRLEHGFARARHRPPFSRALLNRW